jgi:hypothetical protein
VFCSLIPYVTPYKLAITIFDSLSKSDAVRLRISDFGIRIVLFMESSFINRNIFYFFDENLHKRKAPLNAAANPKSKIEM